MLKFKLFLTAIAVVVYGVFLSLYSLYQSPVVGVANAQALTNSPHAYAWANFVAHNGIPHVAFWILILALAIIWLSSILRIGKSK